MARADKSVIAPGKIAEISKEIMDETQREDFQRELEMNMAVSISGVGRLATSEI